MKIGVIGCGIAGTTSARLLAQRGHEVHLFEQAKTCQPIGAGILLQPSGQQVLRRLGILDEVAREAEPLDGLLAMLDSGKQLVQLKYEWLAPDLIGLGVHRGELFQRLFKLCQDSEIPIHTDAKIVTTGTDQAGHWIESQTGLRSSGFDFLIGTDGSASMLRTASGIPTRVIEYDYAALWATAKCDYQPGRLVQIVDGTKKLVGLLPIGSQRSSFFWGLPADGLEDLKSKSLGNWKSEVVGICPEAESLLHQIDSFDDLTFAKYRHVSMAAWHNHQTIFLGDAAHATSPHLGQGVNLALEDAACFVDALDQHGQFQNACLAFRKSRHSKLKYYSQLTRFLSPFFQSNSIVRGRLRDQFLPWFPHLPIVRRQMTRTLCGFKNGWLK